jgi:hypothetical protein
MNADSLMKTRYLVKAAFLAALITSFFILIGWFVSDFSKNSVTTVMSAPYAHGKTPIADFGEIQGASRAYIHIKLRFRTNDTTGYQNVLQTAPVNRGVRIETSSSSAAVIIPDVKSPTKYVALRLSDAPFDKGRWYALDVEALNGAFVRVRLNGEMVSEYNSQTISMEMSKILVGGGYDESRSFRGEIEDIFVTKGHVFSYLYSHLSISSLSDLDVLLLSLLSFLIILVVTEVGRRAFSKTSTRKVASRVFTMGLLFGQILLLWFLPGYRSLLIAYLFLFAIGINQHIVLTPDSFKEKYVYFVLAPLHGLLLLSVVGSYFIGLSIQI